MEVQIWHLSIQLAHQAVESEGKEQRPQGIPLLDSRGTRYGVVIVEEGRRLLVTVPHPPVDPREVLENLLQENRAGDRVERVGEVDLQQNLPRIGAELV